MWYAKILSVELKPYELRLLQVKLKRADTSKGSFNWNLRRRPFTDVYPLYTYFIPEAVRYAYRKMEMS